MPSNIITPNEIRCKLVGDTRERVMQHLCTMDGFSGVVRGVYVPDAKWVGWDANTQEWVMKLHGAPCQILASRRKARATGPNNYIFCGNGNTINDPRKFAEDNLQGAILGHFNPRKLMTGHIRCTPSHHENPIECSLNALGETTTEHVKGKVKKGRLKEYVHTKPPRHVYPEEIAIRTVRRRDRSVGAAVTIRDGDVGIDFVDETRIRKMKAPAYFGKHPKHKLDAEVFEIYAENPVTYTTCTFRTDDKLLACAAVEDKLKCLLCPHLLSKHDESGMCQVEDCPCGDNRIHLDMDATKKALEAEITRQQKEKESKNKVTLPKEIINEAYELSKRYHAKDYGPELYRERFD